MAAGMGKFGAILRASRDRIIIFLLCIAIGGMIYRYQVMVNKGENVHFTPPEGPSGRPTETIIDTAGVIQFLTASQGMEPWANVITRNPFNPERRQALEDKIRKLYTDGLRAMDEADYERAITSFNEIILQHDPFETWKEIYQDKLPRSLINLSNERQAKKRIDQALASSKSDRETATQKENKNDLEGALEDYTRIATNITDTLKEVKDTSVIEAGVLKEIQDLLASAQEKISDLTQQNFSKAISGLLEKAKTRYKAFNDQAPQQQITPAVLEDLIVARDSLEDASSRMTKNPELLPQIPQASQQEIHDFLNLTHKDVADRVPHLKEEATRLADQGQQANDVDTLNNAKKLVESIKRLQPSPEVDNLAKRIEDNIRAAIKVQAEKRITADLQKADDNLKVIREEMNKSPVNWDKVETLKKDALAALDRADVDLKAYPDMTTSQARSKDIRKQLDAIKILPKIPDGVKYIKNVRKSVFHIYFPEYRKEFVVTKMNPPNIPGTNYKIKIIDVSPDANTIRVEVQGQYRETQLTLTPSQ